MTQAPAEPQPIRPETLEVTMPGTITTTSTIYMVEVVTPDYDGSGTSGGTSWMRTSEEHTSSSSAKQAVAVVFKNGAQWVRGARPATPQEMAAKRVWGNGVFQVIRSN